MLIFLLEASVSATFAFSTVRLKQGLPKHPHMAMQRSHHTGMVLGACSATRAVLEQSIILSAPL